MNWILLNIPLGVVMVGFAAGLPLWVTLKHPDTDRPAALDPSALQVVAAGAKGRVAADVRNSVAPVSTESRMVDA